MPERRMLAKSIIESDFFCDMPVDAQMLYIRLNMAADDDGFVASPRAIMRMHGFNDDTMKLLISKNFVLQFQKGDNFVYLIKHWKVHNYIQKDRYKRSAFQELLRDVYYDENKAYSLTPGGGHTPALPGLDTECIHDVSKMDTQVRLEIGKSKDSIGEVSTGEDNKKRIIYLYTAKNLESLTPELKERAMHFINLINFSVNLCKHPEKEEEIIALAAKEGIEIEKNEKNRSD